MPLYGFGDDVFGQIDAKSDSTILLPRKLDGFDDVLFASWSQTVFTDQAGNSVLAGLDGAASRLHLTARSFTGEDALHAYIEDDEVIAPNSESDLSPARLISVNGHGNILLVKPSRLSASHTTNGEAAQVPLVWLHSLTSNDARQILLPLPSSPIINVRAGSSFFLIQCEALLYSFGADNRFGQLGCKTERGTEATLREIDALAGMRLASLSVGDLHCAAIDAETAALYVWGSDGKGQCGGGGGDEPTLVSLPGLKDEDEQLDVLHVGCGANHTVIATSNGVWATGANDYGQLGLGDTEPRSTFSRLAHFDDCDVKRIVCGRYSTLVVAHKQS